MKNTLIIPAVDIDATHIHSRDQLRFIVFKNGDIFFHIKDVSKKLGYMFSDRCNTDGDIIKVAPHWNTIARYLAAVGVSDDITTSLRYNGFFVRDDIMLKFIDRSIDRSHSPLWRHVRRTFKLDIFIPNCDFIRSVISQANQSITQRRTA